MRHPEMNALKVAVSLQMLLPSTSLSDFHLEELAVYGTVGTAMHDLLCHAGALHTGAEDPTKAPASRYLELTSGDQFQPREP